MPGMLWVALLLGIVEGVTEFLPISSTGHLILTLALLGFQGPRAEVFLICIQFGAILSVIWEFRDRLRRMVQDLPHSAAARGFGLRMLVAFLPSAIAGVLFQEQLTRHLFFPATVGAALIVGAVMILVVERLPLRPYVSTIESIDWTQALGIGLAECLALWPGFSRSAATILGGLGAGLDRRTATEFSFFLAIPTLFAASGFKLVQAHQWLDRSDLLWLGLSFVTSFFVAWGSIRWLLRYVSTHSFALFAWYRLAVGLIILLVLARR